MTSITIENPKTMEVRVLETDVSETTITHDLQEVLIDEVTLSKNINNLNVPAEVKLLLAEIKSFSITVGDVAVNIGRKILEVLIYIIKENPKAAMGMLIGGLIGFILSSIPVIGWALSWLIQPLFMALGLGVGYVQDIQDTKLRQQIESVVGDVFKTVKNIKI